MIIPFERIQERARKAMEADDVPDEKTGSRRAADLGPDAVGTDQARAAARLPDRAPAGED